MINCQRCGKKKYGYHTLDYSMRRAGCYACGYGFEHDKSQHFECQGKTQYASKNKAMTEIHRIIEDSCGGEGKELRPYKCKYCNYWHLTSKKI